jgi:dsDNA-binding SOS-regulon protein
VYRNDEWRLSFKKKKVTTVEKDVFDKVLDSVNDLDNVPDIAEMQEMQEN